MASLFKWQRPRALTVAARVVLVLAVPALVVVVFGRGGEGQFSPDSFESRGVTTLSIPLTDRTLLALPDKPYRKKIVQFWLDEGYLAKPREGPRRWDVVTGWLAWQRGSYSGPAKDFWYRAGCKTDEMADEWIDWSRQHPPLAARLWPEVVALLARGRGYDYLAARLMTFVDKAPDAEAFEKAYAAWRVEFEAARQELEELGSP